MFMYGLQGTPLYWRHEVGALPGAVMAYINHMAEPKLYPAPSEEQLQMVIAYLRLFIQAPMWQDIDGVLPKLRAEVETLATVEDVRRWLHECLKLGIDPL